MTKLNIISKKILVMFVIIAIILGSITAINSSKAAKTEQFVDYKYIVKEDATIEITDYTGEEEILEIPSTINESVVTSIGDNAFYASKIKHIEIPESVIEIGKSAFRFSDLESIKIKGNLEIIKESAFANCTELIEVELPKSVKTIENGAFKSCYKLQKVTIQEKSELMNIGEAVFYMCPITIYTYSNSYAEQYAKENNLKLVLLDINAYYSFEYKKDGTIGIVKYMGIETKVNVPSQINGATVTSVENSAFFSNDFLEEINIPVSITQIEDSAFARCENLKIVKIEHNNKELEGLVSIGSGAFDLCPKLTEIYIPKTVTSIGDWAFGEYDNNLTVYTYSDAYEVIKYFRDHSSTSTILFLDKTNFGDINDDGKVNARDAKLVMQHFTKKVILTEEQQKRAEVSGDGKINARDAKLIMQYFTKKIDKFPAEE